MNDCIAVRFTCESCDTDNRTSSDEDGFVECGFCGHTVHMDTYIGRGGYEALKRGEEWYS